MRCFLPCFGPSKRQKQLRSPNATLAGGGQTHVAEGDIEPAIQLLHQKAVEEPIHCISESKIKFEELSNEVDEVTSAKELVKNFEGSKEEQQKAATEEERIQIGEKKDNHEPGDEVNQRLPQEESSESLFSLSIDSRKQVSASEKADNEVNSPIPGKEEYEASGSSPSVQERVQLQHTSSVLNPHENHAQGKLFKSTGVESSKKEAKENTKPLTDTEKFEELPNCISIGKVNPNEDSSVKKLEENKEENGKAKALNHREYRYQDCTDEGYEGINLDESDLDVTFEDDDPHNEKKGEEGKESGDVNGTWFQEESSESLFSLSTDSRKRISSAENAENEVNSLMLPAHVAVQSREEGTQGRIPYFSSVLNPIENLTQRRVVKAKVLQSLKKDKENIDSIVQVVDIPISPKPSLKLSNNKARHKFNDKKQEIGVDTSLSSWLVEPEATPSNSVGEHTPKGGRGSPWSHEDRPILGALTLEEIMKYSASTPSRRSRSRSPDETPIIGTVGSYWSHTRQSMDSDSSKIGKDPKLKLSSTTLKTRLERAFEASVAEV